MGHSALQWEDRRNCATATRGPHPCHHCPPLDWMRRGPKSRRSSVRIDRQHSNEVGESFVISQPRPNLIRQPSLSPHTIPLTGCRIVSRTFPRYIAILATLAVNLSRACLASGRESASPAAAVIDRRAFMLPLRHPRAPQRHRIRHSVYP